METTLSKKRPVGMTILLVLSFINACWSIFRAIVMLLMNPVMTNLTKNGQMEEMMTPYSAIFGEEQMQMLTDGMDIMTQISPRYWLFMMVLFIGSLSGVIRMFKGNKRSFHVYAISQILMLINSSMYLYPKLPQSPFVSDLSLTLIFIMLYRLYFKRMELSAPPPQSPEQP